MGFVYRGIPENLALALKSKYSIHTFVETGTNEGKTALWASGHFDAVYTVEFLEEKYQYSKKILEEVKNVKLFKGKSSQWLKQILEESTAPRLLWLDAHYAGSEPIEGEECPLLSEIESVKESQGENWIVIDDARYFLSPPPYPHNISKWPTISDVLGKIRELGSENNVLVWEDVIIVAPSKEYFSEVRKALSTTPTYLYKYKLSKKIPVLRRYLDTPPAIKI